MVAFFSPKKRRQIKQFFSNPRKKQRLIARARQRKTARTLNVVDVVIENKKVTVKRSEYERLSRANLNALLFCHRKALQTGTISPRHYVLRNSPYRYADNHVGIMDTISGAGSYNLKFLRYHKKDFQQDPDMLDRLQKHFVWQQTLLFMRQNPHITIGKINAMERELKRNLQRISQNKTRFSFDVSGANNIQIVRMNNRGQLVIRLIDQIYPEEEPLVKKRLQRPRKKK
ncbi:MAG: hypothetical protein J4215_00455 [Candidatus Diapherotrites archaeon]|uniref:Uncharacterized protein n=1 Tax=Candidatus Iainarchaeum sp. TaxID=3101447 RepID=A0A8T4L183_9ARCH|nr:hypothetical protein [Candidatus Diapherotrites archaeon]